MAEQIFDKSFYNVDKFVYYCSVISRLVDVNSDLPSLDFYLWGGVKYRIYPNNSEMVHTHKA